MRIESSGHERDTLIERICAVLPKAVPRIKEMDDQRSIPADLFEALEATGVFQALTPKEFGGLELSLSDVNEVLIEGAHISGSLGWVMMIHIQQSLAIGTFRRETVLKMMNEYPRLRIRGAAAPKGIAVPTQGGYIVSGTWPFASGGPSPHLVGANCVVTQNGVPRMSETEIPEMILAWVPSAHVQFLDTWHVLGMRGTDSRDFAMREVFVPTEMTSDLFNAQNWFQTAAARLPLRVALSPGHSAVAIGIARGALDELTELSKTKRAAMNPKARLADDPMFRHSLGECELRLAAARALLKECTADLELTAARGQALTSTQVMTGRTMTGFITNECTAVVNTAYSLAGSASVYTSCPLERRLRDIHVAGQHISAFRETYRILGAAVLGEKLSHFELIY